MASLITAVRDLDRARQIALVLARHGFGEIVSRLGFGGSSDKGDKKDKPESDDARPGNGSNGQPEKSNGNFAQRVRLVLQELGPSFVKLGQIASTRPDLLPEDLIHELKKLQDSVPPFPSEDARAVIEEQLGAPIDQLFTTFEDKPLASASIAQVHRATLRTEAGDEDVVIKVQRPNIRPTIERDIDLLYWFAHTVERAIPESKTYSPVDLVAEFDRSITAELDFVQEAENAERFAKHFDGVAMVKFPGVFRRASGKKVLTLEFLRGRKIDAALAEGVDGKLVARHALEVIIKMIFEDGFFHADPHPGNILILGPNEAPVVGLLDLGLVGHLSPIMRDKAVDLVVAAVREDMESLADALYALGKPTRKVDQVAYRADVAMLSRKYLGKSIKEIEFAGLISDLVRGAVKHGIDMPPDFLMVGKSLMTVEGIGRQLDPNLDVFNAVKPHILKIVARRYSPDKITGDLLRSMFRLSGVASNMPLQVGEILEDLRKGHLTLRTQETTLPQSSERVGRYIYRGFVVSSLLMSGVLLLLFGHSTASTAVGVAFVALALIVIVWWQILTWWTDRTADTRL